MKFDGKKLVQEEKNQSGFTLKRYKETLRKELVISYNWNTRKASRFNSPKIEEHWRKNSNKLWALIDCTGQEPVMVGYYGKRG